MGLKFDYYTNPSSILKAQVCVCVCVCKGPSLMHILRNLEVLEIYRKFELRNLTHTLGVFNVVVNAHPQ